MRKAVVLMLATPYVVAGGLGWWLWRRRRSLREPVDS